LIQRNADDAATDERGLSEGAASVVAPAITSGVRGRTSTTKPRSWHMW